MGGDVWRGMLGVSCSSLRICYACGAMDGVASDGTSYSDLWFKSECWYGFLKHGQESCSGIFGNWYWDLKMTCRSTVQGIYDNLVSYNSLFSQSYCTTPMDWCLDN